MVQYKWIALSNTTIGVFMASVNSTIILISLPAIFNGIKLNPLAPDAFQYLLWILFGYSIVTATLLVTFGRISDMLGRVRLYNIGFAIFTVGSVLLSLTPGTGTTAALEIVAFRIVQGMGAAFLFSNSTAILTDSFPHTERGRALGINQIAALVGSLAGLILGGILSSFSWRYVFLVSVPVGLVGTVWSYLKLKELAVVRRDQKLDILGNATFAVGLTVLLLGITYGLLPYGGSTMGWSDPWVIGALAAGVALLVAFPLVEVRVKDPMFRIELFRRRMFAAGNFAAFLASIARGGVFIILIVLLQGIWLPLHGYSYASTPFWSGIYMVPLMAGFVVMGPISGWLSDTYGARFLATLGMVVTAASFLLLSTLSYSFAYPSFALYLFGLGTGMGLFAAPNTASIMNSVPRENRGAASGMMATLQNTGMMVSVIIFFGIIITSLASSLPDAFSSSMVSAGAPAQLGMAFSSIPPTEALFSAFLGYNPVSTILSQVSLLSPQLASLVTSLSAQTLSTLTDKTWFPQTIAPPFMSALRLSFYVGATIATVAAVISVLRGRVFIHELEQQNKEVTMAAVRPSRQGETVPPATGDKTANGLSAPESRDGSSL